MAETLTVPFGKPQTVAGGLVRADFRQLRLPINDQELTANQELAARTSPPYEPENVWEQFGLHLLYPDDVEMPQLVRVKTWEEIQEDVLRYGGRAVAGGAAIAATVTLATSHRDTQHPYTGPGLGEVLMHNVGPAAAGPARALTESAKQTEQHALSAVSAAQEVTSAISHLGGQHSTGTKPQVSIKPTSKRHKMPKAVVAKNHPDQCSSTGHMPGKTPAQIAMNYFVICEGESVPQAAGVVGNITQESGVQSTEIEGGGFSKNPYDAGHKGWGMAQWTPPYKIFGEAKKYHIKGPIYTEQTQLAIIAAEMKNVSPTGQRNMAQKLKQATSTSAAALIFERDFEEGPIANIGGGQLANRQEYAKAAARDFGAAALKLAHSQWGTNTNKPSNFQHTAVNPGIYRAALKYNTASYSEIMAAGHLGVDKWRTTFRTIGPKALIDCSGLVNMAVAGASHDKVKPNENTTTERASRLWYRIPFSKAGQGDIMQPNKNHVAIINRVDGNIIYTFAARTSKVPQPDQVGPSVYTKNSNEIFLRYRGPGAPLK